MNRLARPGGTPYRLAMTLAAPYREFPIARSGLKVWIHGAPDRCAAIHRMPAYWFASVGVRRTFDRDGSVIGVDPMLMGPTLTAYEYQPAPRTELIGLAIQPEWTPALVGRRTSEIDRAHVWERPARIVHDALLAADLGAPAKTVGETLAEAALTQLAHASGLDRRLDAGLGLLRRSCGQVDIRALAARVSLHERHLRRSLSEAIGLSPKRYARILRLNAVLAQSDQIEAPDWAGIAASFGYSDQAHLIREAVALAGATPVRLHAERRAESVFFNP